MSGSGNIEIETVKLVLSEDLSGDVSVWKTNQLLFETLLNGLRADWAEGGAERKIIAEWKKDAYPNLVASTIGGYEEQRTDWRKRAGTSAYLIPRN